MNLIILLYLVGFIRTLIFIVVVYFLIKLFTRYILPLILENKIRQMQENLNNRQRHHPTNRNEGEVTVDYGSRQSEGKQKRNEGEYVDFEEIE